jgi:type I restriction enzyme R subunit
MHDKVHKHWAAHQAKLVASLALTTSPEERPVIEARIETMRTTDMAVVVSQSQNEIRDLEAKGLDIR